MKKTAAIGPKSALGDPDSQATHGKNDAQCRQSLNEGISNLELAVGKVAATRLSTPEPDAPHELRLIW